LPGFIFSDRPFWLFLGQVIRAPSSSFVLVAVTFFLLMGEILLRSGLSEQLYRALNVWLRRWPGGLLHTNGDVRHRRSRNPLFAVRPVAEAGKIRQFILALFRCQRSRFGCCTDC
jgi:hypothetical protein